MKINISGNVSHNNCLNHFLLCSLSVIHAIAWVNQVERQQLSSSSLSVERELWSLVLGQFVIHGLCLTQLLICCHAGRSSLEDIIRIDIWKAVVYHVVHLERWKSTEFWEVWISLMKFLFLHSVSNWTSATSCFSISNLGEFLDLWILDASSSF
jgi:hypothetical protein